MLDLGSFTIPCTIGNHEFGKAICDFGASINLKLNTYYTVSTNGRQSMTQLEGIIEDVLVKVGKFIFLMDFVVIDMEEDKQVPSLLGKSFLATGASLINVKKGELTLMVGT